MKIKLLVLFGVFVNLSLPGQSFLYHPFPESNAMWTDRVFAPFCNQTYECSINQYTITGDTSFNGISYKKLIQSGYLIGQNYQYTYYSNYAGAFRQDTLLRRVYFFPPYGYPQAETLLYDFNLAPGDSIPLSWLYPENVCDATVAFIDSVLVGDSYRKRFRISTDYGPPLDTTWLVEGIGTTRGLFGGYCTSLEGWQYLTCFIQNDTIAWPSGSNSDCNLITHFSDVNEHSNSIITYPNPVKDNLWVMVSVQTGNTFLSVSNILGGELIERQINDHQTQLDLSNFEPGVYLLKFTTAKRIEIRKVLKE